MTIGDDELEDVDREGSAVSYDRWRFWTLLPVRELHSRGLEKTVRMVLVVWCA
jgi:hypothetical protein